MQPQTVTYHLEATEFNWEIAPGKIVSAWGFNQQVPGPLLKAKKGDTLVVKVKNSLSEPTIVHWHGIRLPATMDGTGEVQAPIQPGEEFEYRFTVPDAGTFWYHSHQNETVQMERGLYGGIIVEEKTDLVVDGEQIFLLDDMKLTATNEFKKGNKIERWIERHDGREGDTLLINGKEQPTITIAAGQRERWRFINAASARYFVLSMGGRPFQIIGTDGGLLEQVQTVTEVMITPGERFDILADPFQEGETIILETLAYNRVTFVKSKRRMLATIMVGTNKPSITSVPETLRHIDLLARQDAEVTRRVQLSIGASLKRGIDFLVNKELHAQDKPVQVGELQVWEVSNTSLMDHPFHLHGFFFQVLEINGNTPEYKAWKDTYNLPPRSKAKIAWMPDNRPGKWMYHCHILEHHAAGMMAHFEVVEADKDYHPSAKSISSCH
jgi:FtsP/CotA-like multicopper oxidase with cupredoxin domain